MSYVGAFWSGGMFVAALFAAARGEMWVAAASVALMVIFLFLARVTR